MKTVVVLCTLVCVAGRGTQDVAAPVAPTPAHAPVPPVPPVPSVPPVPAVASVPAVPALAPIASAPRVADSFRVAAPVQEPDPVRGRRRSQSSHDSSSHAELIEILDRLESRLDDLEGRGRSRAPRATTRSSLGRTSVAPRTSSRRSVERRCSPSRTNVRTTRRTTTTRAPVASPPTRGSRGSSSVERRLDRLERALESIDQRLERIEEQVPCDCDHDDDRPGSGNSVSRATPPSRYGSSFQLSTGR